MELQGASARADTHVMYRILLVDDHKILREGVARLLGDSPDMDVVGEASDGQGAVEKMRELEPDVVLMDVVMPGMDGIEATRIIKRDWPGVRVIGLSMDEHNHTRVMMAKAGAESYLTKGGPSEALLAAIRGAQ